MISSQGKEPAAIYRKDYKAPQFELDTVNLHFDIRSEEEVIVDNEIQIKRTGTPDAPLFLNGEDMELLSIHLDEKLLTPNDYQLDKESLTIPSVPNRFTLRTSVRINPKNNTQLSGLYFADGLFCTQCESHGFRRITYFIDRPDTLASYRVSITADSEKYPVLLSNGNRIAQGQHPDKGTHFVEWEDPFKKPCYLFALVAGNLSCISDYYVTQSGRRVALRMYSDHDNQDKCEHAMTSVKNAMRWDEEQFGREYDLDIYMIVAVRSFNMGAMENKGLNIFNAKYVLARPENAADSDFIGIERVIGHEYFHNWTGNRVTCRDWFQLSLKEGLTVFRDAEFSRDMQNSDVCRIQDVKTLRSSQFIEDASPMAHPVRPESYIEVNNFYTATIYNKGAEVIRMQRTLLGHTGFRKGMDLYFERHDGQAVTIDDFVKAMEDANHADLTQFKRWYSQSGTPEVTAETRYDAEHKQFILTLSQHCPPTPGQKQKLPFHIPISAALWDAKGNLIPDSCRLIELKEPQQTFVFEHVPAEPVISLLRDFSAPIKLHIDYSDEQLQLLMRSEHDGFSRWEAGQRIANKYLTQLAQQYQEGKALNLPETIIQTYEAILEDPKLELSLKAELMILPNFNEASQIFSCIDVDAIESARNYFYQTVGKTLYKHFLSLYETLHAKGVSDMSPEAYAERKMKNVCLGYLIYSENPDAVEFAYKQFMHAQNMTDEIGALSCLVHVEDPRNKQAVETFYQKWQHDDLVMDKWFAVQASSRLPYAFETVKTLLSHPKLDRNNPNKVKALLATFAIHNPRSFHALSGKPYELFTQLILEFDRKNPYLSANLVRSMISWKHYDEKRSELMKKSLEHILAAKPISRDLYEVVSKSLE